MKSLILCVAFVGCLVASSLGQNGPSMLGPADAYDLGGRKVRIPSPDLFTDTMSLYPRIADRLSATESPLNDVLAVHVTDDLIPQIRNGEEPDLGFYTKVSVAKQLRTFDAQPSEFGTLVAEFEKQSPGTLQAIAKTGERSASERLSHHWGTDASLKIGETRMLGHFDKQARSISSMFLMNMEIFQRKLTILGSMSLVHLNDRIVFVYVFRTATADTDQQTVAEFTKRWLAKIIAANPTQRIEQPKT